MKKKCPVIDFVNQTFNSPFTGMGGSFIDGIDESMDQSLNLVSDGQDVFVGAVSSGFETASGGSLI